MAPAVQAAVQAAACAVRSNSAIPMQTLTSPLPASQGERMPRRWDGRAWPQAQCSRDRNDLNRTAQQKNIPNWRTCAERRLLHKQRKFSRRQAGVVAPRHQLRARVAAVAWRGNKPPHVCRRLQSQACRPANHGTSQPRRLCCLSCPSEHCTQAPTHQPT